MTRAIYPGSFDPVTYGHIDIIQRSAKMVDELIVVVMINEAKKPLFDLEERVDMLKEVTRDISNVRIDFYKGLLVEFARLHQADMIVRGLRAVTDFEYELQMSQTNRVLVPEIDTVFLTTALEYSYLSSSIVKEVAALGGDISHFVPQTVVRRVIEKVSQDKID